MGAFLALRVVRDGRVCTLILNGDLDFGEAAEFLAQVAVAVDDQTERLVFDLAGLTFLDCAGARALTVATSFAPPGCPAVIRSLSLAARRIIDLLSASDIENLPRLSAGRDHQDDPLKSVVATEHQLAPVVWAD